VCDKVPKNISYSEAAALASASPAILIAERVNPGERVLVLGAGGGVGSHACQIMRARGASFIAGMSRSPATLLQPPLSYNKAIDYTKEDPFSMEEFQNDPFDVIIDLSSGGWLKLVQNSQNGVKSIIKPSSKGGRYLTVRKMFHKYFLFLMLYYFRLHQTLQSLKPIIFCQF